MSRPKPGCPTPEEFVLFWQQCHSITEVSVALVRAGYYRMTPTRVRLWAKVAREMGVQLKRIRRPKFPATDEDRKEQDSRA